jgi:hypothetical protein
VLPEPEVVPEPAGGVPAGLAGGLGGGVLDDVPALATGELDDAAGGLAIPPWQAVSETPARQTAVSRAAVRYPVIADSPFRGRLRSPAKLDSRRARGIALLSQLCDT